MPQSAKQRAARDLLRAKITRDIMGYKAGVTSSAFCVPTNDRARAHKLLSKWRKGNK